MIFVITLTKCKTVIHDFPIIATQNVTEQRHVGRGYRTFTLEEIQDQNPVDPVLYISD